VRAAQCVDPVARSRALESITAVYWKPVYKYVRLKWNVSADDAADVGVDEGTNVSSAYRERENRFTGKIEKVLIQVGDGGRTLSASNEQGADVSGLE